MSILKTTDFAGFHQLAGSTENDKLLQKFIDKYEKKYIYQLFGVKLGGLIITNIGSGTSPANADYKKVWDPLSEEGPSEEQWISEGVLEILKSCIFWHYINETRQKHTQQGVTATESDTATAQHASSYAESRWNSMLDSWDVIQDYIDKNSATYPDYVYSEPPGPKYHGIL